MAVKPKFYPILPRTKRSYASYDKAGPTSVPFKYRRIKSATWTTKATGLTVPYLSDDATVTMGTSSKGGTKNPGWRILIAKGGDATSGYSREIHHYVPIQYSVTTESVGYSSRGYGVVHGGGIIAPKDFSGLREIAIGRLRNSLNGYIGNAQLAAPLAESREIFRLARSINSLGLDAVKAALAIKKTGGKSAAKLFANVWLGFGFGINPMLKDIEKAANSILDYTTRQDRRVRVVGTASLEFQTGTKDPPVETVAYALGMGSTNSCRHVQGVQIVAGIDLQMRTAASYSVADHLGLKISDIPSTLWELTPYSWVVDYYATVSPWLDDMFYTLPGVCKYVSQAEKYQSDTYNAPYFVPSPGFTWSGGGSPGRYRYMSFTRVKLGTVLPSRSVRIKSVDEIANHGITKLLNLASVLAGRRGPKL